MRIVKQVQEQDGVYSVDIDITTEEWKEMLSNNKIFDETSTDMIRKWYLQTHYRSTNIDMLSKYRSDYPNHRTTPFNGIVIGLGKRIIKHLDRFEIKGTDGTNSYWILPFEGWYENNNSANNFMWKLRSELVLAINELQLFQS